MEDKWVEFSVNDIKNLGWKELASVDESADWEVDQTWIYSEGDKYYLVHASGCSCWGGEARYKEFPSLLAIGKHFFNEHGDYYGPTLKGASALLAGAYRA